MDLPPLSPCDALVAIMVAVCVADGVMRTPGMVAIERVVGHAPVFADYEAERIRPIAQSVIMLLEEDEEGLTTLFSAVRDVLPPHLFDTAYALACDIAVADGPMGEVKDALLTEMRLQLQLDRLRATAIELGATVRHRTL